MKMSIENRARLAFAIVVVLGIVAGLVWYAMTAGQYRTYQIVTQDPVSGLVVDAPVEFHGVDVGKVTQVKLAGPHSIQVLMDIRKDAPVSKATVATITARGLATRGFTGYVYISLEDSGTGQGPLEAESGNAYPEIPVAPSRSLSLDKAISQVNQNVQVLTDMMQTMLNKKTIASFSQSINSLQQVTRMLAENSRKLNTIIANTEQASSQFKPLLDSSTDTVRTLQLQVLPEAYRTISSLNRLTNSMNSLTAKLNRDPSILVRGTTPPPPGPGESK
jgi:phospholipid/cholesterol/gamma-HCH transport system substrate-binding protein